MKQLNNTFANSATPWIAPLPSDWRVVSLTKIIVHNRQTLNPQSHPKEVFDYYSIPAYQETGEAVPELGANIRSLKLLVHERTVLFGKLNPRVPKVWIVRESSRRKLASTEFIPLSPNESEMSSDFLYYLCWSDFILPRSQELVSGSTPSRQRVDIKAFLQLPVPLPPLPEQRAIAQVLRTVQRAKEATERVIAAARELKKSLMRHLFTYGPVPLDQADQVPLKETEIGPVPEEWEVVRLGEIVQTGGGSIQTGPFGSLLHASDYIKSGIPIVMPKDLTANGKISPLSVARISQNDYQRLSRYHLKIGDLIIARRGELGRRGLVTQRENGWVCGTGCIRVRPGGNLDALFLSYSFEAAWLREWLEVNAIGTTMANLSTSILKRMPLKLPSLPEQRKIARILETVDRKIEAEEKRKAALEALFKTLLHHLITGKVRVHSVGAGLKPAPTETKGIKR